MQNAAVWVGSTAAIIMGLGVIFNTLFKAVKGMRKMFDMVDTMETVITRELEHNHGSSMKDDLYGMAVGFGLTQRQVDDLESVVYQLRDQFTKHIEGRND